MRIALVDPFYMPGLGYQSIGWSRGFASLGHPIRVFTSCYVDGMVRHLFPEPFKEGLTASEGVEVLRLPAKLLPRCVVHCPPLLDEVLAYKPDATLIISPGTLFAKDLIWRRPLLSGEVFCSFGDNIAQRKSIRSRRLGCLKLAATEIAFFVFKRRIYRRAIRCSTATLLNTPDALDEGLIRRISRGREHQGFRSKCVVVPLGFDDEVFHVDPEARAAVRHRLGLTPHDVLALYSCKITAVKRLDVWVAALASAMARVPALRTMLIGFREGEKTSADVRALIDNTGMADRFICEPFAERSELARLYNAGDFGVWHLKPSITIQEAMGTGLYMVMARDPTMSHLLQEPETGRYAASGDHAQLEDLIAETALAFAGGDGLSSSASRLGRAKINARRFGYRSLAGKVILASQDPTRALAHLSLEA